MKDLPFRMNTGIGTGRHDDADLFGKDLLQNSFNYILNRQSIDLGLKTRISAAVIGDCNFISQRNDRLAIEKASTRPQMKMNR